MIASKDPAQRRTPITIVPAYSMHLELKVRDGEEGAVLFRSSNAMALDLDDPNLEGPACHDLPSLPPANDAARSVAHGSAPQSEEPSEPAQ